MIETREYIEKIENELKFLLDNQEIENPMRDACYYAIFPAGKRIRPLMVLALMDDFNKDINFALRASVTIEFLHCASLIHDDLPAFDDDDYRRGRYSCHKAFGQAPAILAGDFLPPFALKVLAESDYLDEIKVNLSRILSNAFLELCNGQQLDILEDKNKENILEKIYELKTGGLFKAVLGFASVLSGKSSKFLEISLKLGAEIGVFFQIVDDYIDVFGTIESRGKPKSSDEKNDKITVFNKKTKEEGLDILKLSENKIYSYMEDLKNICSDENITFDNLKNFINKIKSRM